jgi:hypothetical protein
VEGRVTLLGKQADKKMSVKKMKSGIQFFAVSGSPSTSDLELRFDGDSYAAFR